MDFFIGFICGLFVGRWLQNLVDSWAMRSMLKDLGVKQSDLDRLAQRIRDEDDDKPQLTELEVKLEQIGDTIYAYRVDTDEFLGQGRDRDQLLESLKNRLTNVRVTIAKEHGADLIYRQDQN
jgi:hypothetical protein